MDARTTECPSCKQQIPANASFCPYCGARFAVSYTGYCPTCHAVRDLDQFNRCKVCGGEVIDRQPHSQYLGESPSQAVMDATPDTTSLIDEIRGVGKPGGASKPDAAAGRAGTATIPAVTGTPVDTGVPPARSPANPRQTKGKGCIGCRRGLAILALVLICIGALAYFFASDLRGQVQKVARDIGQEENGGAAEGWPATVAMDQVTATPAPTLTWAPTRTPEIKLPAISASAVCAAHPDYGLTCLEDGGWASFLPEALPRTGHLYDLASCGERVLALVSDVLYGYGGGKWTEYRSFDWDAQAIGCAEGEAFWVVGADAAYYYNGSTWTAYDYDTVFNGQGSFTIRDVAVTQAGQLWVATNDNILHYDGSAWTNFEREKDLKAKYSLNSVAVDSKGAPWVTSLRGIATYNGKAWTSIAPPSTSDVHTVFVDGLDRVWVGTDGGVSMYQKGAWQRYPVGKQGGGVLALSIDDQGRVWAGSDFGLGVLDKGKYTFYHMADSDLLMNEIRYLVALGNGPALPAPVQKANGSLAGRIVDGTQPLAKARVEICVQDIGLIFTGATPCSGQPFLARATTGADGSFTISDLPPGYYTITFQTPDGKWKVRSMTMTVGSVQVLVRSGEETGLGELDISE